MKQQFIVVYAISDNGEGRVIELGKFPIGEYLELPPLVNGWIYQITTEERDGE